VSSANIQIQVLGELEVRAGAEDRPLPRSRKTRALLGYLTLTGRAHRREQLCDLFWDVTDDPRAALRWSLTKLRKVLEAPGGSCLSATRTHVQVQIAPELVDIGVLKAAARRGFEALPSAELEALAARCRGELLEGLLLPDFDTFEGWLEAERAEARTLHARLRHALVSRLADEPERALPHARAWLARSGSEEARGWVERLSATIEASPARAQRSPAAAAAPPVARAPQAAPGRALIGRDREIGRLLLIADESRAQRSGRVVIVTGEPGMGKTRLCEELRQRLEPQAPYVLEGVFHEAERHRPLAPFLDALRGALPARGVASTESAALDRDQLFDTIAGLIRRQAEERGLGLLWLDDAHLADPSSSELLHYLVRTAARSPLCTVLCCRPAELTDNVELSRALAASRRRQLVEELSLRPLAPDALLALARAEAPDVSLEHLPEDSAGNPLVALEMARAQRSGEDLPRGLSELVLARLASLPEAAALLVRWGAVLERGPVDVLEQVCREQIAGFVDALETAVRYAFVQLDASGAAFAMTHALLRRVVYDDISAVRRAAMHRRVVAVLEARAQQADVSALMAHHATRAERPDLAARALLEGARSSARVGGKSEASALADRALAVAAELGSNDALDVELGALLVLTEVRRTEQPEHLVSRLTELGLRALEHGRSEDARRAFHAASNLRWEAGTARDGYGMARQAWQASRVGNRIGQARASATMAMCLAFMEKELPEAQAILHEAEALTRAEGHPGEPVELVLARGSLHLHAGRWPEARRDGADARVLARAAHNGLQEAAALQMSMQVEYAAGQSQAAAAAAEALAQVCLRIREGGEAPLAAACLALLGPELGAQRPALERALEQLRQLDDKRRFAWAANRWAQREHTLGALATAGELSRRALEAARAVEAWSEAAIAACELMALAWGSADDPAYAEAEVLLAELEAQRTLSFEARRAIERATSLSGAPPPPVFPAQEPFAWNLSS
jgi:DNA-binding SARP family transcriptional activator